MPPTHELPRRSAGCTVGSMANNTRWERFKLWLARRISNRK